MSGRLAATIRPFEGTLAEYERVTALVNAAWPGLHISAEALRRFVAQCSASSVVGRRSAASAWGVTALV